MAILQESLAKAGGTKKALPKEDPKRPALYQSKSTWTIVSFCLFRGLGTIVSFTEISGDLTKSRCASAIHRSPSASDSSTGIRLWIFPRNVSGSDSAMIIVKQSPSSSCVSQRPIAVPDGPSGTVVFPDAGAMAVRATVTDAAGAARSASLTIYAGNEAPVVRFVSPSDGGFFEYGQPIAWKVETTDAEDGTLPAEKVRVEMARYDASPLGTGAAASPGLALMRQTTCFACHQASVKSAGPAYVEVARRYAPDAAAPARLAKKILSGGSGVWGEIPMPPHPQHTAAEAAQMVNWILSLASMESSTLIGISGTSKVPAPREQWGRSQNGVVLFTATATDNGAGSLPALASPASTVQLRTRRQRAYFFDDGAQAIRQDNLDQGGMVARIAAGGYITFRHIALAGCGGISLEAWPQGSSPLKIEIRRANGSILSSMESISPRPGKGKADQLQFLFSDLNSGSICEDISIHLISPAGGLLDVLYVDFLPAK